MQVPININGVETLITLTPEQVASIEAQSKPKKFKWNYTYGQTYLIDNVCILKNSDGDGSLIREHGRYRKSKEAAEQSLARNKRANRLEALVEQLGGLKKWVDGELNWVIYLRDGLWGYTSFSLSYEPEKVYMTEECAMKICRMLNEGEFSLNGEL